MRAWRELAALVGEPVGPGAIVPVSQLQIAAQRHAAAEGAPDPYPLPRECRERRDRAQAARGSLPAEYRATWQDRLDPVSGGESV